MTSVISSQQISLNGVRYRIKGPVRRTPASLFPEKVVIGDVSRDTHPHNSVVSLTTWPGGIGLEEFEKDVAKRSWWSTCSQRYHALTLPGLAVQTADQSVSGSYTSILATYLPSGGAREVYGAFGTTVKKYNNTTDSWGSSLRTLPAAVTDVLEARIGGTNYLIFAHTGGYTYFDGTTWTADIGQDTKFLTYHDAALWGMDANGVFWVLTALAVQASESGTVSGVETNGSAALDDTGAVFTATIRDGTYWIRVTDAGGDSLTGFIGTANPDADNTRVQIYNSSARTTQNWVEGGATAFDMADTPLTFDVYKEVTSKAQLPVPDGFVTDLFTYRDTAGEIIIYAMSKTGLWTYNQTDNVWFPSEFTVPLHPRAGRGSKTWRDVLLVPAGLSVYAYKTRDSGADVLVVGPDLDDGLPMAQRGEIKKLEASHNDLLALVDGAALSVALTTVTYRHHIPGYGSHGSFILGTKVAANAPQKGGATILGWNGTFWEVKWLSATSTGAAPDDLIVSDAYDQYRMWWVFDQRVYYMNLPTSVVNPSQISDFKYAASATHEWPWFTGDDESADKLALLICGTAAGMSGDETITLRYQLDYNILTNDLIENGGFEGGLGNWATSIATGITATVEHTTDEAFVGSGSLEIDLTASTVVGNAVAFQKDYNVSAGQTLTATASVKGSAYSNAEAQFQVQFRDSSNNIIGGGSGPNHHVLSSTDVSGSWAQLSFDPLTAPAGTHHAHVECVIRALAIGGTGKAWFDEVSVTVDGFDPETVLGTISSNGHFHLFMPSSSTPEGVPFRSLRLIADLERGAANINNTPQLRIVDLVFEKRLHLAWGYEVDIDFRASEGGRSSLALKQAIETAIGSKALVTFNYHDASQGEVTKYVRVLGYVSRERTGHDFGDDATLALTELENPHVD